MYAFPSGHNPKTGTQESGMTLRDYFAAKAMQAFLRNQKPENTNEPPIQWARDAYQFADAMMKAREE